MSLRETVEAILACSQAAFEGRILLPEPGEPVRIVELDEFLITSRPIPIIFTGLRPGDKLTEEILFPEETEEGIMEGRRVIRTRRLACADLEDVTARLGARAAANDPGGLVCEISSIVPNYVPSRLPG